jgi:3-methylfumaryl-CoA hydratase
MTDYSAWIGRSATRHAIARAATADGLRAVLNLAQPLKGGDPMPLGWHWLYDGEAHRPGELQADGLPKRGGFMPEAPDLPRQMFAGARLRFVTDLQLDAPIRCERAIVAATPKEGRSGKALFVTLRNRHFGAQGLAVEEEEDIVYRGPDPGAASPPGRTDAGDWPTRQIWRPTSTALFRVSALIGNAHRIHYDRDHATEVEGYPGLVVQGPLTATLLLELAKTMAPGRRAVELSYRAKAPLFDTGPIHMLGRAENDVIQLAAADEEGGLAMEAKARFA